MSHWFNISRWREKLFANPAADRTTHNPEPDLYQHRVQQIIARKRQAMAPTTVETEPAAQVSATDQRLTGMTKILVGATRSVTTRTGSATTEAPEESEHWISFGVGMAAGVACGWALLFFTMAAMEPDPSSRPRDGATAIAAANPRSADKRADSETRSRHEAARRVLERQVALATAKVLTPPDSGGVERVPARDLPVEEAGGQPETSPVRPTANLARPVEPRAVPLLPAAREAPRHAPKPTVPAAATKSHFDFAGSSHMSRLGASNVTARDVFAQPNSGWAVPPPLPVRHPLVGTAKRQAALSRIGAGAKRRERRRRPAGVQKRRRNTNPKVLRLSQPAAAAAPQQAAPENKSLGVFPATEGDANWARRVLRLDSGTR